MSRPRKLLYPPQLIQLTINRIRRELHSIHRRVRNGEILTPAEAKTLGEEAILKQYRAYIQRLNEYLEKHNLDPLTGDEEDVRAPFEEVKRSWHGIVDDMF